ncbi:MAG TPA: bifunctional DNA-formamidopyrimidine glycosylase/DNA-(apurinic or apyrimidinic site) lyase [Candidatus Obscuribacterales bacterium]
MPELPEVETIRRGLEHHLVGDVFSGVNVLRKQSIEFPSASDFAKKLPGHRIIGVQRRGKYILINLDRGAGLAVHLRMSGRLIVAARKTEPSSFLRVVMPLESGRELRFEDMRVFGRLWYIPAGKSFAEVIPALKELGVEPLEDLNAIYLREAFSRRRQCIKAALIDQTIIAGIGNIYADEALFHAGIHPETSASALKAGQLERLCVAIGDVLSNAIKLGGSTLRDYTNSEGVNGNYQHSAWVYGRKGEACRVCSGLIERVKIAGRSSHFCRHCQPRKRAAGKHSAKSRTMR